jgi:hypothetical protein
MRMVFPVLALAVLSGCSATMTTEGARSDSLITTEGQLRLAVADAPAQPGMMFITGTIVGGHGNVVVSSTRYGSVCATNIAAHAEVATSKITLVVTYSERTAICTADIRAITYRAEIDSLAPGSYDVTVIHATAGTGETVLTERVKVD